MSGLTPRCVVVGGGILGTMHAVEAVRRGYEVVQLERDGEPRGASVRNFGLVWVSGRAGGVELELALEARERWESIASSAPGTGFRPNGSLTLASTPEEVALFEAATRRPDAEERGLHILEPGEARRLNGELRGEFLAALHCDRDAIVEPRLTLAALRGHLGRTGSYHFLPGRTVVSAEAHAVLDHTGERHEGDLVVCCVGADPGTLFVDELASAPLRRVRLQMLETEPSTGPLMTSIADGDSMRYYPAFDLPERAALPPQDPLAADWRAQLLLVQRLAGNLTIGDTHRYTEPFEFDVDDRPMRHLLGVARRFLGEVPDVERRWSGVYSEVTDAALLYYRAELRPGVVVVTGPGGRGMTMSPAIAAATFE